MLAERADEAVGSVSHHMKLLAKLARALVKKDFLASLRAAASPEELVALVDAVRSEPEPA